MKKFLLTGFLILLLLAGGTIYKFYNDRIGRSETPKPPPKVEEPEPPPKELFGVFYKEAEERMEMMTLQEKVGQLFLLRCPKEKAADVISRFQPAGFVLFARDFDGMTKEQVTSRIAGFQQASAIPMLMAVDEEGGSVVRVSQNPLLAPGKFKSPQALYAAGGLDAITADAKTKSALLLSLGLNVNLAPVADVSTDPKDYIHQRAFGQPAPETADYVARVVGAMNEAGLSCCLKHFPGYGDNVDTHTGIAIDKRPFSTFEQADFLPFEAGIGAGAQSVLVSHNIVECMDETLPASLSPEAHRILREELGFTGVILSDSLVMDAIRQYTGGADPCLQAFKAGNDLLLADDMEKGVSDILSAVQSGEVSVERLDDSVRRILAWKLSIGIFK